MPPAPAPAPVPAPGPAPCSSSCAVLLPPARRLLQNCGPTNKHERIQRRTVLPCDRRPASRAHRPTNWLYRQYSGHGRDRCRSRRRSDSAGRSRSPDRSRGEPVPTPPLLLARSRSRVCSCSQSRPTLQLPRHPIPPHPHVCRRPDHENLSRKHGGVQRRPILRSFAGTRSDRGRTKPSATTRKKQGAFVFFVSSPSVARKPTARSGASPPHVPSAEWETAARDSHGSSPCPTPCTAHRTGTAGAGEARALQSREGGGGQLHRRANRAHAQRTRRSEEREVGGGRRHRRRQCSTPPGY